MPNKARYTITPIADGFVDDCDELIQRCLQSETLNYHVFCNIWKDMNFALVFHGRTSSAEVAELSEEFIYIAKRYMVANTSNYEESVAGLFLVYALVHLQPFAGFAPLRLTPDDLDAVHCIRDIARKQKRYDVLYVLGSLLIEGPVQYHIAEREHGLELQLKKGFEVTVSNKLGIQPRGVFFRQNEELDLLRELASLGRRYTRAKTLLAGGNKPDRTLSYVNEHMASELSASLKQLINGNDDETVPKIVSHHDKVQSIKQRAMTDTVNQMKHLVSVETRKPAGPSTSKPTTPKRRQDIRGKAGRIKTGSPTKPVPSGSPAKRTLPRRSKKRRYESSDSDSSTFVPSGDSDNDNASEKDSDTPDLTLGTLDDVLDRMKKQKTVPIEFEQPVGMKIVPVEFEIIDGSRPSLLCENSQSSAELIVPDLILTDRAEREPRKAKEARGGRRLLNEKPIRKRTRARLNNLGILSAVEKSSEDKFL